MFDDRFQAGRILASRLSHYANRSEVVVLGMPRGGVPVAYEVAQALRAPLDVFLVRKLGLPGQEELAIGAIASGGVRVINEEIVQDLGLTPGLLDEIAAREWPRLQEQERLFRGQRSVLKLEGKIAILVDDGLATGSSMRAAVIAVRQLRPARLVVAVPVSSVQARARLAPEVDELECVSSPEQFWAVGAYYRDFAQTSDQQVRTLLEKGASDERGEHTTIGNH